MSSKQMDVALMPRDDAVALRDGAPPLAAHGRVPLHTIVGVGDYLLVCRDDFPARHAWLICEALFKNQHAIPVPLSPLTPIAEPPDARVPLHPGAQAYIIAARCRSKSSELITRRITNTSMGTARAPEPGTASKQYGSAGALSDSANGRSMKGLSAFGACRASRYR